MPYQPFLRNPAPGLLQINHKINHKINQKKTMTSQFAVMMPSHFFDVAVLLLSSLVTGLNFMSISWLVLELWRFSFLKDWLEIGKLETPVWVLPNYWRLRQIRDTKFGVNISSKTLLNATKCQYYCFYCVWAIKRKTTGGRG